MIYLGTKVIMIYLGSKVMLTVPNCPFGLSWRLECTSFLFYKNDCVRTIAPGCICNLTNLKWITFFFFFPPYADGCKEINLPFLCCAGNKTVVCDWDPSGYWNIYYKHWMSIADGNYIHVPGTKVPLRIGNKFIFVYQKIYLCMCVHG